MQSVGTAYITTPTELLRSTLAPEFLERLEIE
jgi:hypothetical protein